MRYYMKTLAENIFKKVRFTTATEHFKLNEPYQ